MIASLVAGPSPVIQRMITIGTESLEPRAAFDRVKGSRESKAYIASNGGSEAALLALLQSPRFDGLQFKDQNAINAAIKKAIKDGPRESAEAAAASSAVAAPKSRGALVNHALTRAGNAILVLAGHSRGTEILYELGLVWEWNAQLPALSAFVERVKLLVDAKQRGAPIDWVGLTEKTLQIVSATWPNDPSYYLTGDGRVSLLGESAEEPTGIITSFAGLNSEFDAILAGANHDLAAGEVVFSGSNYRDVNAAGMDKDVDVSFIDAQGYLNLIEAAKDFGALANKVATPKAQSAIYKHLATTSTEIEHTAAGPLSDAQAHRTHIRGVRFWYNVPPEALAQADPETLLTCVSGLLRLGAGLRSGPTIRQTSDLREWQGELAEKVRERRTRLEPPATAAASGNRDSKDGPP